jgi:hypothetical protein
VSTERETVRPRTRSAIVSLAIGVFLLAALGSPALAGKKKKTKVVVNSGPVLNGKQNVKVSGSLNTSTACRAARSMRLFLTDQSGNNKSTIASATSSAGGSWKLKAKLAAPPTADQYLQVKAKKLTVGKYVCKAGKSKLISITG